MFLSTEGILTFEAAGVNGTVWVQDTEPVVAGAVVFHRGSFRRDPAQQLKLDILSANMTLVE
ncbi:MAG: hypothetical protein M9947_11910 [Thermomicrobiales bacterium]|nr:hypothetical protein [Thermomicrobiales bacterium]